MKPAAAKPATPKPAARRAVAGKAAAMKRWLGCFTVTDDEGVESSFQMLGSASSVERVVRSFDKRLREMYRTTSLFSDGGDVFLDFVIDISGDFETPVLVNWVAQGSPSAGPVIFCDLPEQPDADVDTYGPPEDVEEEEPLLSFKAKKPAAGKRASSSRSKPHVH